MKKLMDHRSLGTDGASLLLRLIFGGLFIYHGWGKIDAYEMILPQFKDFLGIGSTLSFNLVIFAEFVCGILVVIGFLTRLAVIPIFITMVVAYFIAHAGAAFAIRELAGLFMLLSLVIFILGAGKYSVDKLVFKSPRPLSFRA
jgi:putative oxidoreductase